MKFWIFAGCFMHWLHHYLSITGDNDSHYLLLVNSEPYQRGRTPTDINFLNCCKFVWALGDDVCQLDMCNIEIFNKLSWEYFLNVCKNSVKVINKWFDACSYTCYKLNKTALSLFFSADGRKLILHDGCSARIVNCVPYSTFQLFACLWSNFQCDTFGNWTQDIHSSGQWTVQLEQIILQDTWLCDSLLLSISFVNKEIIASHMK